MSQTATKQQNEFDPRPSYEVDQETSQYGNHTKTATLIATTSSNQLCELHYNKPGQERNILYCYVSLIS